jgi:hypothetical protein
MSPTRRSRTLLACVALAAATTAGCSDDGADTDAGGADQGELPSPDVTQFTNGSFEDVRLPRGAEEFSDKTERDGAISQSFVVSGTSPQQIMDFFSTSLTEDGWQVAEPVSSRGTDSYAGAWTGGGRRLEVSALLAQGVENERTQFSLVLLPGLEAGEEVEGG